MPPNVMSYRRNRPHISLPLTLPFLRGLLLACLLPLSSLEKSALLLQHTRSIRAPAPPPTLLMWLLLLLARGAGLRRRRVK